MKLPHFASFRPGLPTLLTTAGIGLALGTNAFGQAQSLSFTGGVLLNSKVNFRNLGSHPAATSPGPATGAAVDRVYDDGFVGVDARQNPGDTTVNWGYQNAEQIRGDRVFMTSKSAAGTVDFEDSGSFLLPSANMEYRGSLGPWGESDWGVVLGIGYASIGADEAATLATTVQVTEDSYSLGGLAAGDVPAPPYAGSPTSSGPGITSIPRRTSLLLPGARLLTGKWEFDADLFPITGGLYLETQLTGRLNGIVSAGVMAVFVNSHFEFSEHSTIAGLRNEVTATGRESESSVIFGGFAGLGLDWGLWEDASLVASARWQPTETFSQSISGREAEMDFTSAFAVHAGFSLRF